MRPKTLVLLALALGCGSIAAVGINQVLTSRSQPIVTVEGDSQPILVAMADVSMGELITPEMVKLEKWPKDSVPQGALTRLEEIEGRRAKVKLFVGEPILEAKLLSKGQNVAAASEFIPKGYRVVAVKVDDISAASNLIKPGDRVDVLVHLKVNPGNGINETKTITVLQDIKVFSVNDVFHDRGENSDRAIAARTVSMLVTPDQAELITHASEMGSIRLVMRSVEDDSIASTHGTTQTDLLGQQEHGERENEDQAQSGKTGNELVNLLNSQTPPQPAPPQVAQAKTEQPWRMVLIEADKAQEVQFEDANRLPTSLQPYQSDAANPVAGPLPLDVSDDGSAGQDPENPEPEQPENEMSGDNGDSGSAESDGGNESPDTSNEEAGASEQEGGSGNENADKVDTNNGPHPQ